ncbi:AlbA family DNA-binding domain-containing protein [Xanthomonas pisi]|uniref:ATP-binding protein n=1 Tax=Xanthomonas pisi TaxID=56457 RepID=A0A2S7CZ85_9XANT|nr:ATP-binding protein [Xanthomonas pisi]KLD70763.1 ATPase AAA [Xanthomonas pisi DSM 18956]PPU66908.1 ATP-binding protein [Xanthomonas pisi]
MTIEPWADAQLSEALPRIAQCGESESVEFKRELPKQVRDLAKEIAAFASSGGGQLLLGVADDGSIPGIANAHDPAVRDDFERRVVGVCQIIDPPVRPQINWASVNGGGVLVVTVKKGSESLYYVDSRAYIRHGTVSRPATPAEIRAALVSGEPAEGAKNHPELSALADVLANVRRWSDTDAEMRSLKPWVDEWSADAENYASKLSDLSVTDWAVESRVNEKLDATAEKLDELAQFRHYLGGGDSFDDVSNAAGFAAAELMRELVDPVQVSEETQREVLETVAKLARKLAQIWDRAGKEIFDGRVEKAQQETYGVGQQIAKWTYFRLSLLPESTRLDLRRIGLGLLQLVSMRVYMDGGASLQRIVDDAQVLVNELKSSVESFPRFDR